MSVASFYDMFHLEPVGRHLVEVCTNISCALVGAQQVVEAFERELGVARRRDDGGRRRSRCASSSAPAAAAGARSSRSTTATASRCEPEDVPGIVAELAGRSDRCRVGSSSSAAPTTAT